MPQIVDIPNVGRVNFPDGMTPEQIAQAIERDILPSHSASAHPFMSDVAYAQSMKNAAEPVEQPTPSVMARMGRGMEDIGQGLTQRALQIGSAPFGGNPAKAVSIQELRAAAEEDPKLRGLSDDELRAKFNATNPVADYTAGVNDELAQYAKGRAAQGGGFDLARIAGNVIATAPAAFVGPAGATVPARAGAGAIQGALSGASQFTPSGKLSDTAINTALSAGTGAVVAPVVGAVSDKALDLGRKMVGAWRGATADADPTTILKAIPEFQTLPPEAQRDLIAEAQDQIRATGTLNAEQLARKANLVAQGVTPTKSMVTRNPADWTLERNLQKLAQSPDETLSNVGQELTSVYQANDKALTGKLAGMSQKLPKGTPEAHGMTVMQSLDDLAKSSQEEVGKVYEAVRAARGDQLASDAKNLATTLDDLKDSTYAEKLVGSVTNKLRRFGMLDKDGNLTSNTLTVTQAEELRKFVNKLPNDYGKQDVIRAIDADVMTGLGDDAFSAARGAAKARFATLDNPATQRALNTLGELTQGKTAQNFIKSQVIDAADQDVASLVGTLSKLPGDKSQNAMDALRAGVLQHLEDAAGDPNSAKFSGAALNKAIDRIGDRKLSLILGTDQAQKLQNLARAAIDATYQPPYSAVNNSNTAPMLMSLMQRARTVPGVPLLVTDEAQKLAAQAGYRNQLAQALAARAQAQLPQIPQGAQDTATILRSLAATAPAAATTPARQRPHR